MKRLKTIVVCCFAALFFSVTNGYAKEPSSFRFTLTGDPRAGLSKWRHTLKQMKARTDGKFAFHITAGDYFEEDRSTMAFDFYDALKGEFGDSVVWYPGLGNHELKGGAIDVAWLRQYYRDHLMGKVNPGPKGCEETTYSWDYKNAHFVQLDMYYDGTKRDKDGVFSDLLYDWLVEDLNKNTKQVVFVIYHEPAFPNGRGGKDNSPAQWKRFLKLLNDRKVVAGLCAHTHTYARYQVEGDWESFTWEVDAGNAGRMSHGDKEQTFVDITVYEDGRVRFDTWRGLEGEDFKKTDSWTAGVAREAVSAKN
ncbi:MAG TPA: metallophosphoesterase [Sedimentisphaerales bacterium]|nr:metallophosphoesterase [Sedimentisphaerales bacterium]